MPGSSKTFFWLVCWRQNAWCFTILLANDDILFFDEDFNKVIIFADKMGIFAVYYDKINLEDDDKLLKDDPNTIIHIILLAWCN